MWKHQSLFFLSSRLLRGAFVSLSEASQRRRELKKYLMRNRKTISSALNFRFVQRNNFVTRSEVVRRVDNIRISFQIVCFTNKQHDHRHYHYHHLEDIFPRTRRRTPEERKREIAKRAERRRRVAGAISRECRHACRIAERGDQGKRTLEDWATRTN